MTLTLQMINLDCADVAGQAAFWSQALGVPVDENDGNAFMRTIGYANPALPRMMFLAVPEGKTVKNRLHLDLVADDRAAEVARLEGSARRRCASTTSGASSGPCCRTPRATSSASPPPRGTEAGPQAAWSANCVR